MSDETRQLARFAIGLDYADLPADIREKLSNLLVDQIGVQIGGAGLPWSRQVWETYRRSGGKAEATVVKYGDKLPACATAFINSTFGHAFEYDDANRLAHGHVGGELIPALLAIGEREKVSGKEFFATLAAAYEIRGRIGWALSPDLSRRGGPQYSTSCGPFGAAAGVARLLRLPAEGVRNAMAIAGCFSGGLAQYDQGGGSAKRIYTAIASAHGIQSAELAQAGLTGPEGILEGDHGLLRIYGETYRPEVLVRDLGTTWTLDHVAFKAHSCSAPMHSAIEGMQKLVADHALDADAIEVVDVYYPLAVTKHVGITAPNDLLGMQFSTSYSLALTVLKGANTPVTYTEEALRDPRIQAFAKKVTVHADPSLEQYYQDHRPARVKVRASGGATYETFTLDAKGSSARPMTRVDIDDKFREQSWPILGDGADALLDKLRTFESVKHVAEIVPLLVAA